MPRKKSATAVSGSKTTAVKPRKAQTPAVSDKSRRFTPASYRSRRKRRRAERGIARTKVTNSYVIFARAVRMLFRHWEVFGGILLIFTVLNLVLFGSNLGGSELQQTKDSLADIITGKFSKLSTGLSLFGFLIVSGSGITNSNAVAFQTILLVIASLAIVWALRQLYAGNRIRVRDAFYNSTYPLVQVILVLLMITVHLLPAVAGVFAFETLVLQGILTVTWQQVLVSSVSAVLLLWTVYLLCASLFAAYIVTLPDMTPLKALRSAKDIVKYRRGMVLRKLLFLPVALLILAAIIMVPLTILVTPAATAVFFLLTLLSVPIIHSYMYTLYRELIS